MKRTVSGMMLTLLFIGMLTSTFNIQGVNASGTIYIDSDYTFTSNIYEPIVVTADNITIDGDGYTLEGPGIDFYYLSGFDLTGRSNVTVKNVNVKGWDWGIHLGGSKYNTITQNYIASNRYGIDICGSQYNVITQNNITGNMAFGIMLCYASYNTMSRNNITNNGHGINLDEGAHYNIITQNYIANSYYGINCWFIDCHSKIIRNNITNNDVAISLDYTSGDAIIQNNIVNNGVGVEIGWLSNGHRIYHNNFIGNTDQVYVEPEDYPKATWDNGYPSGGNYWNDYTGVDLYSGSNQDIPGSDGIGDTPYVIDDYNQDRYPLMNPWPFWATACSVWTTDADGNAKVKFDPEEMVYVRWSANGMVNMTVYAPDGVTTDREWIFLLSSGVVSFVPSHGMGIYEIDCTGAKPEPIAIATFLLIPQLPFLSSLLTLVTMLAVYFAKKRKSH